MGRLRMWPQCLFRVSPSWPAAPSCLQLTAGCHIHRQLTNLREFAKEPTVGFATYASLSQAQPLVRSFEDLGLGQDLLSALSQQQLLSPTEIQVVKQPLRTQTLS